MNTASPLKDYRKRERLTFDQLGALFGVDKATAFRWERGAPIPPHRAIEIESRTGIPRHQLRPDLWPAPTGASA